MCSAALAASSASPPLPPLSLFPPLLHPLSSPPPLPPPPQVPRAAADFSSRSYSFGISGVTGEQHPALPVVPLTVPHTSPHLSRRPFSHSPVSVLVPAPDAFPDRQTPSTASASASCATGFSDVTAGERLPTALPYPLSPHLTSSPHAMPMVPVPSHLSPPPTQPPLTPQAWVMGAGAVVGVAAAAARCRRRRCRCQVRSRCDSLTTLTHTLPPCTSRTSSPPSLSGSPNRGPQLKPRLVTLLARHPHSLLLPGGVWLGACGRHAQAAVRRALPLLESGWP